MENIYKYKIDTPYTLIDVPILYIYQICVEKCNLF